jgi:hypothetical protein
MDQDLDPGGPKTCGSGGCGSAFRSGSATLILGIIYGVQIFLLFLAKKIRENEILLHSVLVDWPLFMRFFQTKRFAEF